jgi:hypothetical protein
MRKVHLFILASILLMVSCKDQNHEIIIQEKSKSSLSNTSASNIIYEEAQAIGLDNAELDASSYTWNITTGVEAETNPIRQQEKIIKEGDITVESTDLQKSKDNLDVLIQNHHAFKDNETFNNNEGSASYDLKIRIPAESFERFISDLEMGSDEIIHKNIYTKDVTEEYIDIATRLNNKRAYLQRYQELLAKANKVEDILAIQEEARGLQEEIESAEARLKNIDNKASYSTLDLNLFSKKAVQSNLKEVSFFEKIKHSLGNGWNTLVDFVLWIISVWPGIIILLFAIMILLRVRRRNRIKRQVS